jgi:DNA-binding MarR family transcriptional regulator
MRKNDYINIQGWMVSELKLKSNELMIFALIHGFSKDGINKYKGSLQYIANFLSISKRSVVYNLNSLIEKQLISKQEKSTGNLYEVLIFAGEKSAQLASEKSAHSEKSAQLASEKSAHNININNNNNINNKKNISKKYFENSMWYDYETLRNQLLKDKNFVKKFAGVDLREYIESVHLWGNGANSKNQMIMRTDRGWFSTLRQFMRSDLAKGKLIMIKQSNEPKNLTMKKAMSENVHTNF